MQERQTIFPSLEYSYDGEHDIHEYVFYKSSKDISAAWFEHLDQIVKIATEAEADEIRLLVDVTHGGNRQPVSYMFNRAKELASDNPNAPIRRYAVVGNSSAVGSVLSPFMRMLRLKFRFFMETQREQALEWLRKPDN